MVSLQRDAVIRQTRANCARSRFMLGLIQAQTPGLGVDARAILDRIDRLDGDVDRRNARSLAKRSRSIQGQVAAIGLRSKSMMMQANR